MLQRKSRISAGTDAARRRGDETELPGRALLGPARDGPEPREKGRSGENNPLRYCYCGGLTPSFVICTRVAVILPPASVVTAMTAY